MARSRISTTVDDELLSRARALNPQRNDSAMMEQALEALLAIAREAEIDRKYAEAYAEHPFDEPDDWGDLASFGDAVRAR
jgi:post-segregation antitoxin (ccd killing protein)